jgi:hypothetical protein
MPIPFEPTKSYCYRAARYDFLDQIAQEPEALSRLPFRMIEVARRVIERNLNREQLMIEIPAAHADRVDTVFSAIKFFVMLHAKRLQNSPFIWLGDGGMYRLKDVLEIEKEIEEAELEAEEFDDDEAGNEAQYEGWIYAFSFPSLLRENDIFPIKIGKTIGDVEARVTYQCKGSASFDNPVILGRWEVKRVTAFEQAIHAVLKSRGKWRENVPGVEWFNTSLNEIEQVIRFIRGA